MKYFLNRLTIFVSLLLLLLASCEKDMNSVSSATGVGGSLSRFTIVGNYLYAVDDHFLYSYDISNGANPIKTGTSAINFDIETIYPFNNRLFIGTRTGLYIYSLDTPSMPSKISEARHARSCDPVVANDSIAFVTLKGSSSCGPAESGLYVHNIKNIFTPLLIRTLPMSNPEGLALNGNTLYICCNNDGLRVVNVGDPANPVITKTLTGAYFKDAIVYNNHLICFVSTGIMLYDIGSAANPVLVKTIAN